MRFDLVWYHVIWNTYGSWLPGDPRGFRNRDHRIHSSGDYHNPPAPGEHANLLKYNQARTAPMVRLSADLRERVAGVVLKAVSELGCSAAALSVAAEHVHVLAEMPADYDRTKAIVGKCKTYASLALRERLPGTVWSRGCALKRVADEHHWAATRSYIIHKQEPGAYVWDQARSTLASVEQSAARAAASGEAKERERVQPVSGVSPRVHVPQHPDAAARAADASTGAAPDPNVFTQSDAVEVRRVINRGKGGRAVFARRDIAEGELVERVPVLMLPRTQVFGPGDVAQRAARISWYVFEWLPTKRGYVALSLGYGSIYNHSDTPNAAYDMEPPDVMLFNALRPIAAGEEILISYAGAAGVMKELGFEAETTPPEAAT